MRGAESSRAARLTFDLQGPACRSRVAADWFGYPAGIVGEYLTIPEVARLLHRRTTVIREYATRREDPLPFRIFEDQGKGPLIHRDDLRE